MDVKREEGLKRRIGEDNIGYKLMIKMGFKGDGGIGKKCKISCSRTVYIVFIVIRKQELQSDYSI